MPPSQYPALEGHQWRVLLIDDEQAILKIYKRALGNYGIIAEGVCSGKEALEQVAVGSFDVVVSDVHMPECDGLDLIRAIHKRHPELPIIVMSGKPTDDAQSRALGDGAFRYLVKPVMPSALRSVIESAVRGRLPKARSAQRA
jgi:DNA-binding NtrC family response regulator